jgi:tetratricopeptide (TPR) repeat protein
VNTLAYLAIFISVLLVSSPSRAQGPERILVMPFDNVTRENRVFWLTEAAAVLLADDLNALGVDAITREERREAFERLQVPTAAPLTNATVIRIGQLVGASHVIVGTLRLEGDVLEVEARSIALDAGRILRTASARNPIPELFSTFERLALELAPSSSGRFDAARRTAHPPVAAFENYIKGLLAESPTTAIGYLAAALEQDASFALARMALWDVHSEQGDHESALAAVLKVPNGSPLAARARFRVGLSQLRLDRYDASFGTYRTLAETHPSPNVFNNLGIVQLRRGPKAAGGNAPYFFHRATEIDPDEPDYFFNLGYTYWLAGDVRNAAYWLREAVRRDPADGDAHYVLGAALAAVGSAAEANREKDLARRLSSAYFEWDKRPPADQVPKGLERVRNDVELPHLRPPQDNWATTEQRDQRELAAFHLDRGRRLFKEERDREALDELNRTLFLSPYHAEAHLVIGRIHLRGGRISEAIDALKISLWSAETAEGHAVLAKAYVEAKDPASARAEARSALVLDPGSVEARDVLGRVGDIDAGPTR